MKYQQLVSENNENAKDSLDHIVSLEQSISEKDSQIATLQVP